MQIQVVLPPDLELTPSQFAETWNDGAEYRAAAQASTGRSAQEAFDPGLADAALVVLQNVALGIGGAALYDLIRLLLIKQGVRKRTQMIEHSQPDGTRLIIVTVEEE